MLNKKYTIDELKNLSKKVYPQSLKEVRANKYKVKGFDGYLLLDEINKNGTIPQLFYRNKWRQDDLNIIKGNILYALRSNVATKEDLDENNRYVGSYYFGRYGTLDEAVDKFNNEFKNRTDNLKNYSIVVDYETREEIFDILLIKQAS